MSTLIPPPTIPDWRLEFKRLEGAYAPSTMRAYYTDIVTYTRWCAQTERTPFPGSVATVRAFLVDQGPEFTPSTVRRRIYAIRKVHQLLCLPDPTHDEDINLTFRRIRRSKASRPRQAKGMTKNYLDQFLAVQPDTPWGLRNRAMLSLGYDLLARRSELVALTVNDVEFLCDGTLRVLIRRSKTDPEGYGRVAFTSKRTEQLMTDWLDWRSQDFQPLFNPIYHGHVMDRHLSDTSVKHLIKSAAKGAGLDPDEANDFSGHSMRVGAAQDLLKAGHDTAAIMRAGGWKSINVLTRYLENAECNVWL
ncbi:tyrosine-type recombinase/integrase (plasmid) [Sulfitobacter faviae]|uniref:Tyrosine-type recombinase/integrase n=1 Tax=Sulfitobacter faviae TaxID=1775881 RepID=A0ABZ0V6W1_9RHOB|nr:tyrosine-type recombinase/integrase [Sulfitobacter faviae]WPZ23595.1 tyrosine-type recombinase/integrase [Sulfitobacter faviae]